MQIPRAHNLIFFLLSCGLLFDVFQNCAQPNEIDPNDSADQASRNDPNSPAVPGQRTIRLNISADTQNYDIYVAAGSPASAVNVQVSINPGVTVGSADSGKAAPPKRCA